MVDLETVFCLCGDVGFPDSLFRCNNCLYRFQHSIQTNSKTPYRYCSNFYKEYVSTKMEICDWCRSEGRRIGESRPGGSSKKPNPSVNSLRSVPRIKRKGRKENIHKTAAAEKGKNGDSPSPRAPTRRYKLLKDVM